MASVLTRHLPFPLHPKDQSDRSPRATLHPAVARTIPLYPCKSLHSVLSGKGNLYLEYQFYGAMKSYIGAPTTHSTTMNKRREIALIQFFGTKDNMQRERISGESVCLVCHSIHTKLRWDKFPTMTKAFPFNQSMEKSLEYCWLSSSHNTAFIRISVKSINTFIKKLSQVCSLLQVTQD